MTASVSAVIPLPAKEQNSKFSQFKANAEEKHVSRVSNEVAVGDIN